VEQVKGYCIQKGADCSTCEYADKGRDCLGVPIRSEKSETESTAMLMKFPYKNN
jgi:hypothetical protein